MKYLKYTPYVYLFAAVFFVYKALDVWSTNSEDHLLFLGIASLSVLMFFFRRHYAKKFEARNKSK
jgi:positive regulator of sigma E activity